MMKNDSNNNTSHSLASLVERGHGDGPVEAPQATARWMSLDDAEARARDGDLSWKPEGGSIWLGRTPTPAALPVAWRDDRHIVTIAASRSGKGTSAIIPVLCDYPGSVIVLDPKGENATITATRRGHGSAASAIEGLHQDVYVLDPFGASKADSIYHAHFDPMTGMRTDDEASRETARLIADALIISVDQKDAHWDDSAKAFIEALILHVATSAAFEGDRTLGKVHALLRDGDREELARYRETTAQMIAESEEEDVPQDADDEATRMQKKELHRAREALRIDAAELTAFEVLLQTMEANDAFNGAVSGAASGLNDLGDRERGSVLSTARRNMKFLDSEQMKACLGPHDHMLDLSDLKRNAMGVSVYIVLPSRHMRTHSRWMRMILNLAIARMESDDEPPERGHRVLAVLDEFATLGHMQVLETAAGYMAGFGLTLWTVLQDLGQIRRQYPQSWETFLGNAGVLQVFANADQTTLDYVSKRLGETEVLVRTVNSSRTQTESEADPPASELAKEKGSVLGSRSSMKRRTSSTAQAETTNSAVMKAPLATSDEVRLMFSRESGLQLVMMPGDHPLVLERRTYHEDEAFAQKYQRP